MAFNRRSSRKSYSRGMRSSRGRSQRNMGRFGFSRRSGGFSSRGVNRNRDIRLVIEQAATPAVQAADLGNLMVANAPQKAMF